MHSLVLFCCDYETMQPCKIEIAVIQVLYYNAGNEAMDHKSSTPG